MPRRVCRAVPAGDARVSHKERLPEVRKRCLGEEVRTPSSMLFSDLQNAGGGHCSGDDGGQMQRQCSLCYLVSDPDVTAKQLVS